jgi:NAD-reducing hydrogenase small subunit
VISFGDCAVTGNVTAMRNSFDVGEIIETAYGALSDGRPVRPDDYSSVARLLPRATPLHEVIPVDAYLHGCPPTADQIWFAISELLAGRIPAFSNIYLRYG